ncbi:MAG TPA: helix-turn-helix transcriptional regulator [bacterium]
MYRVRRDWLTGDDGTKILRVHVELDGAAFVVEQASGNRLEIPWDFVLYHSDPTYRYYKGNKIQQDLERDAAVHIGRRIRELRQAKGLTANELARRSGVLRPNVSRLEGGKHVPTIDTLERIARALHVSLVELLPPQKVREDLPARGVPHAAPRARSHARRRAGRSK